MSICPSISELRFYGCCHPCLISNFCMLELSNSSEKNFVGHTHISTNAYMWENVDSKMRGRDGVGVIAYVCIGDIPTWVEGYCPFLKTFNPSLNQLQ